MASTRKYNSRFKCAGDLKSGTLRYNFDLMESDSAAALRFSSFYAFGLQHTVSGTQFNILARAPDFTPMYPSSAVNWDDSTWGARKHTVSIYNNSGVLQNVYDTTSTGYTANYTSSTSWGAIFVSFYREIEIVNNSAKNLTFKFRQIADSLTWGIPGTSTQIAYSLSETDEEVSAGSTIVLKGYEPIEIEFAADSLEDYDYSIKDQNGSVRRMTSASGDFVLKTEDGSIIDTPATSGVFNSDDGPIKIDDYLTITVEEGDQLIFANIGSSSGSLLHGDIGAGENALLHEAIITETEEGETKPPSSISGFAYITISWDGAGYEDLDCCAYWTDLTAQKIGWSYSAGSVNDPFKAVWQGDDRGTGPEYIQVGVDGNEATDVTTLTYRIHLNFYGPGSGTATANVEVTYGGVTLDKDITPNTNRSSKATTSDPYVTITFNANGTPASIV